LDEGNAAVWQRLIKNVNIGIHASASWIFLQRIDDGDSHSNRPPLEIITYLTDVANNISS